jgi:hypothetical protein
MKKIRLFPILFLLLLTPLIGGCPSVSQNDVVNSLQLAQQKLDALDAKIKTASTQPGFVMDPSIQKQLDELKAQNAANQKDLPTASTTNNPGDAVTSIAPALGPLAPYAMGIGAILSLIYGNQKRVQACKTLTAFSTAIDGLSAAFDSGQMTVTKNGTTIVDAAVTSHPATDQLIDVLTANQGAK